MHESTARVPEVRAMVAVARQYVRGLCHFTELIGPTREVEIWAKVSNAHPKIQEMARDWSRGVDMVWNEFGQHPARMTETELRQRILLDLGESALPNS